MAHSATRLVLRGALDLKYNTSHKSCGVTRRKRTLDFFDSIQVYVFIQVESFMPVVRPKIGIEVCAFMF